MWDLITFRQFVLKILSENEILTSIKGHNCLIKLRKLPHTNHNLDCVHVNAFAKFGQISSICSQDIKQKYNSDINQRP